LDKYTLTKINKNINFYKNKYIAFLLFEDNESSRTYIKMKQKKAEKFQLETKVIEQPQLQSHKKAI
jgi:5,10-methylene-tetrahydrofolate dehydrogenase/methenyl tetrahydrofolate cyclohydrolase